MTFGIGFLWLAPYMLISFAKFYDDVAHPATKAETVIEGQTVQA
ncbi:MAG: hypothetical protein ACYC4Q_01040 [Victivallaceae bacterium]